MPQLKKPPVPEEISQEELEQPIKQEKKVKYTKTKAPDLSVLKAWLTYASSIAKKKQWDYFVIDQFVNGNHNIKGNPQDNSILVTKRNDSLSFPVNKVYSTFRAVRAFVTRHKPKAEVSPTDSSDSAKQYARRANKILERDNTLNNSRRLNKEWVYYGIKYGMGWRQVGYDQEKHVAIRWTIDPNHMLIGASTGRWEDAPYLIKGLIRTVGYWKKKFPKADISPDDKVGINEYEELSKQVQFQSNGFSANPTDEETAIGYECWYKLFDRNSLGGTVNKCLFTDTEILQFEETPYTEYPFVTYEAEVSPDKTVPDGHLKQIIAPQRMFNLLNAQLLEYNHIVNRGRILKDKNAGFKSIFAKEGQIIEKNAGKSVQVLPPPPLNPALQDQLANSEKWIEDIGGQHDASLGTTPSRVSSGDAIEALQLGDSNNISDLRDNFEDALGKEAAFILKMYSLFEKDGVVVQDELKDGTVDKFGVVGNLANGGKIPDRYYMEDDGNYCDICAILPDNQVKVSVTSELGETKQARIQLLMSLVEMGLPFKSLLEYLEFPDTSDVLSRIEEEEVANAMLEGVKTQAGLPPQVPAPVPTPEQQAGVDEIAAELG